MGGYKTFTQQSKILNVLYNTMHQSSHTWTWIRARSETYAAIALYGAYSFNPAQGGTHARQRRQARSGLRQHCPSQWSKPTDKHSNRICPP